MASLVHNTIERLKLCRAARAAGYPVSYATDPSWIVLMAIARRAGWPDDPTEYRGTCMPVNGKYPKRAEGMHYLDAERAARAVNTPRLIVRPQSIGSCRQLLLARIPDRFTYDE